MIWWLIFEKKPFQFWREIWIQVVVILLQLYLKQILIKRYPFVFYFKLILPLLINMSLKSNNLVKLYHEVLVLPKITECSQAFSKLIDCLLNRKKYRRPGSGRSHSHLQILRTYLDVSWTIKLLCCGLIRFHKDV